MHVVWIFLVLVSVVQLQMYLICNVAIVARNKGQILEKCWSRRTWVMDWYFHWACLCM